LATSVILNEEGRAQSSDHEGKLMTKADFIQLLSFLSALTGWSHFYSPRLRQGTGYALNHNQTLCQQWFHSNEVTQVK